MSNGLVIQIIGAGIDVEFEKTNIPNIYEALEIDEIGIVITNNHVIERADEITVIKYDQSEFSA